MYLDANCEFEWIFDERLQELLSTRCVLNPQALPFTQTQTAVVTALKGGLADKTLRASSNQDSVGNKVQVEYVQVGERYDIFEVTALLGPKVTADKFILVVSQGGKQRDQEITADFRHLNKARQRLEEQGLPLIVPKPYQANLDGFFGTNLPMFSDEALRNHFEVNSQYFPEIAGFNKPYTYFFMHTHTDTSMADEFTLTQELAKQRLLRRLRKLGEAYPYLGFEIRNSAHYQTARLMKEEILARLYLIYHVLGGVPKEFEVNAGCFMANPESADFDFKLTTIRGGLLDVTGDDNFRAWALGCQDYFRSVRSRQWTGYPLFDNNLSLLEVGIAKAKRMIRHP